ncbi:protein phosphatase 2C domain-containing protein [Mitsuaria sp. GD03876]|uniref:PP2C family protein-serine/threonine phosphatase n=1 Tax=Mitsuaria sp. GD03876 TaxID=2975399 RepID=UPI00244D4BC7|nr:protein phosphatase 2C domain-containing protein [Mitsuaria sp. GD03876]MDH0867804.1 protein phosphatase 2C domain-containing protein [Mitsuaria sp. GD03876]
MLKIRVAACSEQGARANNEDAVVAHENGPGWYAVLADGAGGHRNGAEAARRAVHRMQNSLGDATLPWRPELLTGAVLAAHDDVRRGVEGTGRDRMHTTVVALCVDAQRNFALWTHVGDSRLYRIRGGRIDTITQDDSVVQMLIEAGMLTPEQAEDHPHKNHLVAALGIEDELHPHTTTPQPLEAGDVFLLCSDGWWGSAGDALIHATLASAGSPDDWLAAMRAAIEDRGLPDQDNFSAIALWVGEPALTVVAQAPTGEAGETAEVTSVDSGPVPLEEEEEDESTRRMPL